jgi:hypothetical protein
MNEKRLQVIRTCRAQFVGDNIRACNLFVQGVANALVGPKAGMNNKNANAQVLYMRACLDWETLGDGNIGAKFALTAANRGRLVVAGWKHPTGLHGHVAIVVSDGVVNGWPRGFWGEFPNGPGGSLKSLRETFGQNARPATEFFAYDF